MWHQLNSYGLVVKARQMKDGGLKYRCPFCDQPVELLPGWALYSENHVRTVRRVWCPWKECDVPYEIKHSNFVSEEDERGHPRYQRERRERCARFLTLCRVRRSQREQ